MAKYDELCILYQEAESRLQEHEASCYTFIEAFFSGLSEFLQCPEHAIQFHQATADTLDLATHQPLLSSINHSSDGFYEVIFSILIQSADQKDQVLAAARFGRIEDAFIVRVGMSRKEFQISEPQDQNQIYEYIYEAIRQYYQKDGFIKKVTQPIGFAL